MADLEDMSKEALIELIDELNRDLEERENHIQQLEKENIKLSRANKGGGGRDDDSDIEDRFARAATAAELEDLRDKYEQQKNENSIQKDKIAELNSFLKAVEAEKLEAEADCRRLRKKADDLETQLNQVQESTRSSLRKSQDINKQQKDTQKQQLQLFQENERLQEEKAELTKKLEDAERHRASIEELIVKLADEKESIESDKNAAEDAKDTLLMRIAELEKMLDDSQNKLTATMATEGSWEMEILTLKAEFEKSRQKYELEIAKHKEDIASLNSQMNILKDTTSVGTKQREIDTLKQELNENLSMMDEMRELLENAEDEKGQLVERLLAYDKNFEAQLYDKISAEKESSRMLQKKLQSANAKLEESESRVVAIEKEKAILLREVDELNNWRSVYESGHGFQELARHQKKLKEDNRRLGLAIEQTTERIGEIMDSNAMLKQAFEKLKVDCGVDPDFYYPEYELREDMLGENSRLKSQVHELEEQISALENDCIRLRKALKNQAGAVGEQGFKFQGMSPDQLVKVNEFASSLRDGKVTLPMDNRSSELLAENRKLKEEAKVNSLKIEKYERDLVLTGGAGTYGSIANPQSGVENFEGDLRGVRNDLQRLMVENSGLKDRLGLMQEEILLLLSQNNRNATGTTEGIENMLLANNEILMKELQDLRIAAAANRSNNSVESGHRARQNESESIADHPQSQTSRDIDSLPPTGRGASKLQINVATSTPRADGDSNSRHHHPISYAAGTPVRFGPGGLGTPMHTSAPYSVGKAGGAPIGTPMTPHGKQLLSKTIGNLKLPPEEWADEVKDLNGQLIECLEQLYERENELYETRGVVASLEESLINIKQQTAVLYYDFAEKSSDWERREKQAKVELESMIAERDDAKLKLRRAQDTIDLMQREDPSELEAKLREYSKKISIFEVNEAVLARKYTALSEQLNEESIMRRSLEAEFCEMEGSLKKRILFLEHSKAEMTRHLDNLQKSLDLSVPQTDYFALQTELECLREDHLAALTRELQVRLSALHAEENCRELATIKLSHALLEAELHGANASRRDLSAQLELQKEGTRRAIQAASNPSTSASANELGLLVSEMARFRGEAGRLEVELSAANRRTELLRDQLTGANHNVDQLKTELQESRDQLNQSLVTEQSSRKECLAVRLKYQGGLTAAEAERLTKQISQLTEERDLAVAEVKQQSEIAEIATQQTQSMANFRDNYVEELKELRKHCQQLESRSDDDLIIGRLQRTLMSTKSSYKTFARKYQLLRASMRQRDLAMRVMETRLDNREQAVVIMRETQRVEVSALKKAIRVISNMAEEDNLAEVEINRLIKQSAAQSGDPVIEDVMALVSPRPIGMYLETSDGATPAGFVSIGQRLLQLSKHIEELFVYATDSAARADSANKQASKSHADLEDIQVERDILIRKCEDLNAVLSSSTNSKGDYKHHQNVKAIATRISSLTDEVKSLKLSSLANKREIATLKSQKKHLQELLGRFEDDVRVLEKFKVAGETKTFFGDLVPSGGSKFRAANQGNRQVKFGDFDSEDATLMEEFVRLKESIFDKDSAVPAPHGGHRAVDKAKLSGDVFTGSAGETLVMENEEYMKKLDQLNELYLSSQREVASLKSRLDAAQGRLAEAGDLLSEKEEQLSYCERVMESENLPLLRNTPSGSRRGESTPAANKQFRIMKEEQDKLQEAASATIGSLRLMLDEKNQMLDKYRAKIESLQEELAESGRRPQSVADRRADDLLKKLQAEDEMRLNGVIHAAPAAAESALSQRENQKLLDQLEGADEVMKDKIRTIMQLEQKLSTTNNQRERAEDRCAAALQEMEAMKSDLLLVVQQLQASEQRVAVLQRNQLQSVPDTKADTTVQDVDTSSASKRGVRAVAAPSNAKLIELSKANKAKDEKLKSYRAIILRLKDEFIKAEEERAVKDEQTSSASGTKRAGVGDTAVASQYGSPELDELRSQVSALRDGLKQAKEDLDQARKAREKLLKAKQAVELEAEKYEAQVARAEAQATAAQEMLQRCRKDLEDSRRKEVRLRDKLREMLSGGGSNADQGGPEARPQSANTAIRGPSSAVVSDREVQHKIQSLERDIDTLRAQNEALRRQRGNGPEESKGEGTTDSGRMEEALTLEVGTKEEMRNQLHAKWEAEKKMQKRLSVLEKRLQDKVQECDDAQMQLRKAKETIQQFSHGNSVAAAARERERKEREERTMRKLGGGVDAAQYEEAQRRIFDLEDDNTGLRRKCEVEMPNEIANLRFQCDSLRVRVGDLDKQLKQTQEQLRKRVASAGLREEEEQYLREERMRDDLEAARRQKMELEAIILEKDSRIIELSFEAETSAADIGRYRRRTQELENYCRDLSQQGGKVSSGIKSAWGGDGGLDSRGVGSGFKREKDLEAVVEAMKVVIDKLKLENDRLRKGVGVSNTTGGGENSRLKIDAQKKKIEALEEELNVLRTKVAKSDDSSQKVVQKTQQIASLRKAVKQKEDELLERDKRIAEFDTERESYKKTIREAQARIQQLELQISSRVSAREAGAGVGAAATEISELKRKVSESNNQVEVLQQQLIKTRQELAALRGGINGRGSTGVGGAGTRDSDLILKLTQENEKLKKEMSAFDLEFFEEIENLKYAHAEAMKKLRTYERQDSSVGSKALG